MGSTYMKNVLNSLGYSNERIFEGYSVQINGTSAIKFDYVAFSDKYLKDISTSCIAMQRVNDDNEEAKYIEGAKYLAAPILVISKSDNVRVWKIEPDKNELLNDAQENIVYLYFEKNRFEFMPENLIASKMGYKQLNIFEALGLIDFSRKATCKILSEEFEKGITAAKTYLESIKKNNDRDINNVTSITMHIISALIINSKVYSNEKMPNIWQLFDKLSQTYKEYFDDKLMKKYGKNLPDKICESLECSINYQSVDHELLGYFYESTLLQLNESKAKNIRKEFGIYYTPKVLSQEIAAHIPFENIPVDNRFVLDGTCGSGSLLLSACKRLEDLISLEKADFDRHEYLTNMIQGYDVDKFASEVAKLSLLLYSLPYGNKWNIKTGNLLRMNTSEIRTPYVILGNPPYREIRGDSERIQKAAAFVDKYLGLIHDGGYIGIVLPESFMQNDSCSMQRERLLNELDILELWMLPGQIFENNCSTMVLIAQKKQVDKENITKIKMLARNKYSVRRYFKCKKWDFEFSVNIQSKWKRDREMKISPVEKILQKIVENTKTINDITENGTGIMAPSYILSKQNHDGWVPYIANAKNFRRYVISPEMDSVQFLNYAMAEEEEKRIQGNYGGFRLRRDFEYIYSSERKVLVKMSSTPGEIECISAFVDESRRYPSHSFFCLISNDEKISDYVICALINSKLINAYMRRECVKRTLTTKAVRSIPVPEFTDDQIKEIESCYCGIKDAYCSDDEKMVNEFQNKIDDIIFEAFGLTCEECNQIKKLFAVYKGLENDIEKNEIVPPKYSNVSGEVESINIDEMSCLVYLAEFGEQKIAITSLMPGWFLRENAEFSAKYYEGKLFDIKPLAYSYLKGEELIEILSNDLSSSREDYHVK